MDQDSVTFGRMPKPEEPVSLRDLYDASYRRLVVHLCGTTGDLDEAERVVREAFVRAVASGWRFWRVSNPEAWLRTTATRVHRSRWPTRTGAPTVSGRRREALRPAPEQLAPQPAFDLIEAAGLARRRRRFAVAGALATCVFAVAAIRTEVDGASLGPAPTKAPTSAQTHATPGMTTPRRNAYELTPSTDPSLPAVRLTVPTPWSAWLGPGRADGLAARVTDDEMVLLEDGGSYAGLLVAQVTRIAHRDCTSRNVADDDTTSIVRALADAPRLEVVSGPHRTVRSGRPAVRLRLRERGRLLVCPGVPLFETSQGPVAGGDGRTTYDAWVVDVDGEPLLVWAGWTRSAPASDVAALQGIVDSFVLRDRG